MNTKKKFGIVGCGYLGTVIAKAWKDGFLEDYELVGVTSRTEESAKKTADLTGSRMCKDIDELLALKPDYVVEAASGQTVRDIAETVLGAGADLVVLSIGAFADAEFFERAKASAKEHNARIHIASGAIGGFDVLRTIALMSEAKKLEAVSGISTHKGPASLKGTPIFKDCLMTDVQESQVFAGNAKEAIALFPTKVNVAVATALATTGPEITGVQITSVPGFVGDDHCITAEIEGIKATVDIYSSTSEIAAWSVVALLRNLSAVVVFQ